LKLPRLFPSKITGFSLLETLVSLGMGCGILIISSHLILNTNQQNLKSIQSKKVSDNIFIINQALEKIINDLNMESFDPTTTLSGRTLATMTTINSNTNTTRPQQQFFIQHKGISIPNTRSSHVAEIGSKNARIQKKNMGALISKCIYLEDAKKTKWTPAEIEGLKYAPYPFMDASGEADIKCCKLIDSSPANCKSLHGKISMLTRTFWLNEKSLKLWPNPTTDKPAVGTGFISYFDHPTNARQITYMGFVVANTCHHDFIAGNQKSMDTCEKSRFTIKNRIKTIKGNFYDRGIINLGH